VVISGVDMGIVASQSNNKKCEKKRRKKDLNCGHCCSAPVEKATGTNCTVSPVVGYREDRRDTYGYSSQSKR
jgi:hypothetical protein